MASSPPAPLAAYDRATVPTAAPSLKSALLIVFGLLAFAVAAILLLRCLLRRWAASSSSSSSSSLSSHTHPRHAGGAATARRRGVLEERDDHADAGAAGRRQVEAEAVAGPWRMIADAAAVAEEDVQAEPEAGADDDTERIIASLPLFTMASALAALPKNSPDCAVCLSPFDPSAELRLLPACRHAFHGPCIDAWLRTNLVCPICRSAVSSPSPLPPHPVAADAAGDHQEPLGTRANSTSFRVELGSVSNRRSSAAGVEEHERRTYSLGGSFDYRVDEEVEAIVSRIVRPAARPRPAAAEPGGAEAVADTVGSRGWLGEHIDRVASFSGRWSGGVRLSLGRRHDDDSISTRWDPEAAAVAKSAWSWRWSQGNRRDEPWDTEAPRRAEGEGEEEPALVALARWIFGL